MTLKAFREAPHRWITDAAKWWLGPPMIPKRIKCATCGQKVESWRRDADGRMDCLPCAVKAT